MSISKPQHGTSETLINKEIIYSTEQITKMILTETKNGKRNNCKPIKGHGGEHQRHNRKPT